MKKIFLLPAVALLLSCTNEAEKEKTELRIDNFEAEVTELKIEKDSLEKELELLKSRNPVVFSKDFDSLEKPEVYIVEALERNSQLIPEKSVLGGTMRFIDTEILNQRFIWAAYEDGHLAGEAIFQYKLNEADSVDFKLISEVNN
ncbi:hypothetical protein [Salegentibacter salarius]|uniref:Uncharacterized protein n=1 Tax=Salegentibacter salarius TaxID=435906 RepID=A0A2N0TW32_9FLAO|nr:hypothetical protein [Salegentibacter salarius]OEY72634.1 hypothetical protein BHS39_12065 [Salegentibacter salarius]PKD18931.1 hypothetical protein APR40_12040 [Salegentibacter salarius]SLK01425.1 hypothetical protein SAMN05660445_02486 [Salegentibacter salarius]